MLSKLLGNVLAIDLGSFNTLVYSKNDGNIIRGNSKIAIDIKTGDVVAIGDEATIMHGKSPENVIVINPIEDGSISDFDMTKILLNYYIDKVSNSFSLIQPKVVINIPSGATDIEFRAVEDACIYSGARSVYIMESPLAIALGAGFDIDKAEGRTIVNFGAGNTEISIISMNGIVLSKNLRFGANKLDNNIMDYIYDKYSLLIGEQSAIELKESLGNVGEIIENNSLEVSGRDLLTGMPISIDVFESDIKNSIIDDIYVMIDEIKRIIEKTPPELAKDIIKNGIYITGGLSKLKGLKDLIEEKINIKVISSQEPIYDVINGLKEVANNLEKYKNIGK